MHSFSVFRFTSEERAKRPQLSHMPFGFGPRNCIGLRLALLEAKVALIEVLKSYTFVRAPETEVRVCVCMHIMCVHVCVRMYMCVSVLKRCTCVCVCVCV